MAESAAGRSTVLRALKTLETDGLVTRRAQFHESGAQRSSRYYLNHPDAPHLDARPGSGPRPTIAAPGCNRTRPRPGLTRPRPDSAQGGSHDETGRVPFRRPPRGPEEDPLKPPGEPPSEPRGDSAESVLRTLPAPWILGRHEMTTLASPIRAALADGWTIDELARHLARNPEGVRSPARVLAARLAHLPEPAMSSGSNARPPWCGECEDEQSRTITITTSDGSEAAAFCPRCSPQATHRPGSRSSSVN